MNNHQQYKEKHMNRKSFFLAFILIFAAGSSFAEERQYGMGGCGLGSLVIDKDGGQITAVTTNGSFYSQLGGITSGTSNCIPDDEAKTAANQGQEMFMKKNIATLQKEIAQGSGETLVALSEALGCSKNVQDDFNSEMQKSYSEIFSHPGALAVLDATKNHARKNTRLAGSCRHLSM